MSKSAQYSLEVMSGFAESMQPVQRTTHAKSGLQRYVSKTSQQTTCPYMFVHVLGLLTDKEFEYTAYSCWGSLVRRQQR